MTKKLLLTASALGGAFFSFALTGPAHAETFMCDAFLCQEDSDNLYPNRTVCSVGAGKRGSVDIASLRACVETATSKALGSMHVKLVSMHVVAQGASGRSESVWNGGRAVTQYPLANSSMPAELGAILYYDVGIKPAELTSDGPWLLERPLNASFVATTEIPTVDSVIVLAGGGGSKGRTKNESAIKAQQGPWTASGAVGGRGGRVGPSSQATEGGCAGDYRFVCAAGAAGGGYTNAGGGGGGGALQGGSAGSSDVGDTINIPSEGGWGELYGPAANGAFENEMQFIMMGGEGGAGDGGGGGGGVDEDCSISSCDSGKVHAAAGGGGGSRALINALDDDLPVFEEAARVEFVFNYDDVIVIGGETLEVTRNTGVATELQNFTHHGWQNDTQLLWRTTAIGDELDVSFDVLSAGVYNLTLNVTKAQDFGNYKLFLNGVELTDVNGYSAGVELAAIDLGARSLNAGANTLTLKIIGKSSSSYNYYAGIDFIGFVPLPNLALSGTASQSSTAAGGVASRAIDNNTSGVWSQNSVTHTDLGSQPYWDLDLGSVRNIQTINVFNRTDCCSSRLNNFYVFVSDAPFTGTTVAASQGQAGVQDNYYAGVAGVSESFEINSTGRYVRVQLSDTTISGENVLSLAEVQVIGN